MDQVALTDSGDARKGQFRVGMKGLMGAIASFAFIAWAGSLIRDHLEGYQPLRGIRSGDIEERRAAALYLSRGEQSVPAEAALAALVETLDDEDAGVRSAAAQSLGSLLYTFREKPPTTPVAPDLFKRWKDVATRGLVRVLSDRDPDVRTSAAIGLGMLARRPGPATRTPSPLSALRDASNDVRRKTARMIYGSPDMTLMPELVSALRDESAAVRAATARALKGFGPDLDAEIPALILMMETDEAHVRAACFEALEAAWPPPSLVPTLTASLKSHRHEVRARAIQLLGRIGPEARPAIPALIPILNEPFGESYPYLPQAAAQALGEMGPVPEAIAALVELISPEKVEANLAAWRKIGPNPSARTELIDDRRPAAELRVIAQESLRIKSAIHALGDIGPPAVAAVPGLIAAYDKSLEVHHSMAQAIPAALGRIAPNSDATPDAVAVLIRALDAKDPSTCLGAVEALAHFGTDASAAIPKLRAINERYARSVDAITAKSGAGALRLGGSGYLEVSVRDAAAKSLAALEAPSRPDAGAERGRPDP
ncbi:MAG: HEAT repeat domain-containing protein [Isosphaeraceae bacterium]